MTLRIAPLFRPIAEHFPSSAAIYRALRDEVDVLAKSVETPWGFYLSGNSLMASGEFERSETQLVQDLLQDVDVLVNIGANIGYYCCHALRLGKHVIAFEPIQRNLRHLFRNVAVNGWNDIEIFPVALSDRMGVMKIYGGDTGASVVKGWAGTSETYSTFVPSMTLDTVLGDRLLGQRVLVILDVEGAEHMVLSGATKLLENDPKPTWLIEISATENQPQGVEVNPHLVETFGLMFSKGYEGFTATESRCSVSTDDVKIASESGIPVCGTHNFIFRSA